MKTHEKIMSAVKAMADYFGQLSVTVPFRGYDVVVFDYYTVTAYKVGNKLRPLEVKWEDITPIEAFMLKRACRYTLDREQSESEIRLTQIMRLRETFEKSPFGC